MFWWIIWALIFIFVIGNDSEHWGTVWAGRSNMGRRKSRADEDYQLRHKYMKSTQPDIVVVNADDYIPNPDHYLEKLIEDGLLDEAREYRLDMERMAEQQNDDEACRKYAIYGARISKKKKELYAKRKKQQYYKKSQKDTGPDVIEVLPIDPTLATKSNDPFTASKTKPPLWGSRTPGKGPVSHLEFDGSEQTTGSPVDQEPESKIDIKTDEPAVTPEPVISEPPTRPDQIEKLPDYTPGPVPLGMDNEQTSITRGEDEPDQDNYEDLIDL